MTAFHRVSIEARKVSLSLGDRRVLSDIDLRIEPGEFFCLLGPSGAGKTSFLRVIAGLAVPESGELLIDGERVTARPPQKRGVGMVFQGLGLWPHMTVAETVGYGLAMQRLSDDAIRSKVGAMLEIVGLTELADKYPGELSGGQQQKVALARALAVEPRVLLLDQPLSSLDQTFRTQLLGDIHALQRELGITTVMVTHEPEEALSVADRVAVIRDGTIRQTGSPAALYDYPADSFVAGSVGTVNLLTGKVFEDETGQLYFSSEATGELPLFERLHRPSPGSTVACFRPTSVRFAPYDALTDAADAVWIQGRITRSEFRGGYLRYSVCVGDETVVCDLPHRKATLALPAGSEILVGVETSQIRFINV